MDMFTPSTPETESPDTGHEEELAEETTSEQQEQETIEEQEETEQDVPTEEEETDPEGHSESLLAGKYKTPADLENAYLELQRQFTKQRMTEKQSSQQPPQQPIQQDNQDVIDFNDPDSVIAAINRDPKGTIAQIAQQAYQQARTVETQEQAFQRGIDEVAETYKDHLQTEADLDAYFGRVHEVCRELGVNPKHPSPRVLKMAAQELYGNPKQQSNAQVYQQAKAAARSEIEQTRRTKGGLGAPSGAKVQEQPKTQEELIREGIVAASRSGGMFG